MKSQQSKIVINKVKKHSLKFLIDQPDMNIHIFDHFGYFKFKANKFTCY